MIIIIEILARKTLDKLNNDICYHYYLNKIGISPIFRI
jgi:hypothetical protein